MTSIGLRDASVFVQWDGNIERALRFALSSGIINLEFDDYPTIVSCPRITLNIDNDALSVWQIAKVIVGKHGLEELLLVRELYEGGVEVSAEFVMIVLGDHIKTRGFAIPKVASLRYWEDKSDNPAATWEWYWDEAFQLLRTEAVMLQKVP